MPITTSHPIQSRFHALSRVSAAKVLVRRIRLPASSAQEQEQMSQQQEMAQQESCPSRFLLDNVGRFTLIPLPA